MPNLAHIALVKRVRDTVTINIEGIVNIIVRDSDILDALGLFIKSTAWGAEIHFQSSLRVSTVGVFTLYSFSIFTLQQQYKLQHTEEKLKELQEIVESRCKNILFEYSQKLQVEREARMKLENETKLMEKQVCGLFMLALKKSNILISYMVCARQLHIFKEQCTLKLI